MQLEQITAELYALDPAHFVSARDERVRAARAAGDKALATAISRLRRPTVAAWAVNLLARNETQELGALLDLGEALSRAQRTLAAEQMRTLAGQRRAAVNALTHKAARLAAESGKTLTGPVLQDVTRTLNAALAEPELAQQVRAGVVTTAAEYAGFGPAGPELAAVPDAEETTETPDDDLTGAVREVESARAVRDSARDELERRRAEVADLAERITSARAELDRAEEAHRFAATGLASAETAMERADTELERAEAELAERRGHRS
ncbi:hypothetical protein NONO_c06940 [Nocardia nova SH22a]|uniref:Uncharacterized protein n=1 Tax=Nocardia nova SH22a TaxID=1415166 RepID=W5T8H5_9NOCA|nr:hypothetical protein [Nocardia nova]AHH15502.1 hypothetical protein NONO_c06940 [Nocardia nova SH22a]